MITIENLTKSYLTRAGRRLALDDVSLQVDAGSVYGVLGASGAGKSTLARCLSGQETPDRGSIRIGDTDLASNPANRSAAAGRHVATVPASNSLLRQRTVAGNVAMPLELAGVDGPDRRSRVGTVLDLVGLTERAAAGIGELTAGQRARLNLARALVSQPTVLIADQPTRDTERADSVFVALDRARAELGTTVVLLTSEAADLRAACDEVAVLDGGRVVERGNLLTLATDARSLISAAVLPEINAPRDAGATHQQIAEIVLVGFAAVGGLLPEAQRRFGVSLDVLGGGMTRFGETPLARFLIGVSGSGADAAVAYLAERAVVLHANSQRGRETEAVLAPLAA
ncbi:MAG: methionine ABC transporter ATP-binding protein [Sciscionella sp.]